MPAKVKELLAYRWRAAVMRASETRRSPVIRRPRVGLPRSTEAMVVSDRATLEPEAVFTERWRVSTVPTWTWSVRLVPTSWLLLASPVALEQPMTDDAVGAERSATCPAVTCVPKPLAASW